YLKPSRPLIAAAGADNSQGSSRDWAAQGVRLAGAEPIVANGCERIRRSNLVGMGVLPLQFKPGVNRNTLELAGTELNDDVGEIKLGTDLASVITRSNGEKVDVPVTCRLENADEVSV
ncbi:hypothetical protein UF37_03500, partial [Vibrio parahaemolyticus]